MVCVGGGGGGGGGGVGRVSGCAEKTFPSVVWSKDTPGDSLVSQDEEEEEEDPGEVHRLQGTASITGDGSTIQTLILPLMGLSMQLAVQIKYITYNSLVPRPFPPTDQILAMGMAWE